MELSTYGDREYWVPGDGHCAFTEFVFTRGIRLVPEVTQVVCERIGMNNREIDNLVTNRPNQLFLRSSREALDLPEQRPPGHSDRCGDLFAAVLPTALDEENRAGRLRNGSVALLSVFAHAGDFAAAAAICWGAAR
ncbi:3-oxoacyl-[acyl-carrier-protein] synthase III C-terminal domain-containing protein [Nocardia sienata]|uniref:3-oxoacyl-[acyl-carrier-protein] synthase III C-terminal domain-containing protein n=1 Tax=Nocardia sienata TaxID=248552 RepID=UPI0007A51FA2|nr:3-oxoacyl-[acyl-carrier-protein] synthase III C-terminal domain-containing protein [Nocardia sienata]